MACSAGAPPAKLSSASSAEAIQPARGSSSELSPTKLKSAMQALGPPETSLSATSRTKRAARPEGPPASEGLASDAPASTRDGPVAPGASSRCSPLTSPRSPLGAGIAASARVGGGRRAPPLLVSPAVIGALSFGLSSSVHATQQGNSSATFKLARPPRALDVTDSTCLLRRPRFCLPTQPPTAGHCPAGPLKRLDADSLGLLAQAHDNDASQSVL